MKQIVLSKNNEIITPRVHDANIRGFVMCSDENMLVPIRTEAGKDLFFIMYEVDRFHANDLMKGNTILCISVDFAINEDKDTAFLYGLDPNSESFLEEKKELNRLKKIIVKFLPSYGCEAVCLCSRIEFSESGDWKEYI